MTVTGPHAQRRYSYDLPPALEASQPPEARGLTRDAVRMLVAHTSDGSLSDSTFTLLSQFLGEGDLVVLNTSGTIPAAVDATAEDGSPLVLHFSTHLDASRWVVELRRIDGRSTTRWRDPPPSRRLSLPGGGSLELDERYRGSERLWIAKLELQVRMLTWLAVHGRPIRYSYIDRQWPIEMYQNVYVTEPGSAEMPSAGRPFTPELITRLVAKGVGVTPIVLHTGVASIEADELPYPERVRVPAPTAERVNTTRKLGGHVIAVGTTVVRALETSVGVDGCSHNYDGWTDVVVTPDRGVRLVDGLLTGWHEPASSHLLMLEAIMGPDLLQASYDAALANGYLWHEFGDVHLILP